MKHAIIPLAAALLIAACSPQVYPLHLDVRQPSSSGLDLNRKSMSIVYMDGDHRTDSLWDRSIASAMARCLEEDYFGGEEVVGLYHIPSADSVDVETMHSLVMNTEKDVVFVLSSHLDMPADTTQAMTIPLKTRLSVYDSMGEDKVHSYRGSTTMKVDKVSQLGESAEEMAQRMTARFLSGWKTESFSFYYFEDFSSDAWTDALQYVYDGKMGKAIDQWTPLVKGGSVVKRACAAYNLAMAFYLLEDYEMSEKWLTLADKWENLSLSAGLHTRLAAHLEKTQ